MKTLRLNPILHITLLLALHISSSLLHAATTEPVITRYYTNKSLSNSFVTNVKLQGSIIHIAKFKYWLNKISTVPIGKETLSTIINSQNSLKVISTTDARYSAGRTIAPMTEKLINGIGDDVEIWFDGSITEAGSHLVYNSKKELIEFTAIVNLFHELVHAKHKMKGTWLYFDSEGQAIREENIFRAQYNFQTGKPPNERSYVTGVPIESVYEKSSLTCDPIYKVRSNPPRSFLHPCS